MHFVVEQVVTFAGQFMDSVNIDRPQRVLLIDREILGTAIDLPRAGEDHTDLRIVMTAGFENGELGSDIDLKVRSGIADRIHVAGLAGKIEKVILVANGALQTGSIPHI